jgi:phosphopantetheine adenylyltransferase
VSVIVKGVRSADDRSAEAAVAALDARMVRVGTAMVEYSIIR